MIKYHFDSNEKKCGLHITGSLSDILAETITMIRLVHDAIEEQSKPHAELFKSALKRAVDDGVPYTALEKIQEKVDALRGEEEEEEEKDLSELLDDLGNVLNELLDGVNK